MSTGVKDIIGGIILPSLRYNTCPCLLSIQVSRLPFSSSAATTFTPAQLSSTQNYLQLDFYISQTTEAAAPDFHTFTLAAEKKRVNNESDDGGGCDG